MFVRFTLVWPLEFFKTNDAFDLNNETKYSGVLAVKINQNIKYK